MKVANSEWWDAVFHKDYELMSLKDLETFVRTHKHLPDIPAEEEIQDNGVDLSTMVPQLLKKIEELTLYTIEQEKKIEALKNKQHNAQQHKLEQLEQKIEELENTFKKINQ